MGKVTKQWTMRDGSKIRICDMTDSHLLNAIRCVERQHSVTLGCYMSGPMPRGEMAQDAFNAEFDALDEGGPSASHPLYDALCDEADRRGLLNLDERKQYQLAADMAVLNRIMRRNR